MTYGENLQKSHTEPIPRMCKVLIMIKLRNNRNSFSGSRTAGRWGGGRGGTPPYSPTPRAHTIKGSWSVVAALCWLCFLVFLVVLLSFYIVFEI